MYVGVRKAKLAVPETRLVWETVNYVRYVYRDRAGVRIGLLACFVL